VLDGQEMKAVLADVDGGDTFGREAFVVGEGVPFSEELEVVGISPEGVGALPRGRKVPFEAIQDLLQWDLNTHGTSLV